MKNLMNLKQRLSGGWTVLRIIRLVLASMIIAEAWRSSELLLAVLGGFLAFQAIFNYGCCGAAGCDIDQGRSINP